MAAVAATQTDTYILDRGSADAPRQWDVVVEVDPAPEAIIAARRAIAEKDYAKAQREMDSFIDANDREGDPYLPEAYMLRADSYLGRGFEYKALFDLERILREYPASEFFITANEREMDIALAYAGGLRKRIFGMRLADATDYAVEILIRIQERLPGSALAEKAAITLADFYYNRRDMRLARDAYDLYILNFPNGPNRLKAERRLIFADIARFKGPRYDSSGLLDARIRIKNFERRYPAEAERIGLNDGMIARIDESLAAQLLDSAKWYLTQNDAPAARITLTRLLAQHPRTYAASQAVALAEKKGWDIEPKRLTPIDNSDAPTFEGPGAAKVETAPDAPAKAPAESPAPPPAPPPTETPDDEDQR